MAVDWDSLVVAPLIGNGPGQPGIFGEAVEFAPASGASSFMVNGVYQNAYNELDPAGTTILTDTRPWLGLRAAEFISQSKPLPLKGDRVTIVSTGEIYYISQPRPDNKGRFVCWLNTGK